MVTTFLRETYWRFLIPRRVIKYRNVVSMVQNSQIGQFKLNDFRLGYLREYWEKKVDIYKFDLMASEKPKQKELYELWPLYDD